MPLTFADVLILRYLGGTVDEGQTVKDFDAINYASDLKWSFKSQLQKFIRRFWNDPYRKEDTEWIQKFISEKEINVYLKLTALRNLT